MQKTIQTATFPDSRLRHRYLLSASVLQGWIFDFLSELPSPISEVLTEHYKSRTAGDRGGEIGPWLVADMAGAPRGHRLDQLMKAWAPIHCGTLFLDDLVDGDGVAVKNGLAIGAAACAQNGTARLCRLLPTHELEPLIDPFLRHMNQAAAYLLQESPGSVSLGTATSSASVVELVHAFSQLLCATHSIRDLDASQPRIRDLILSLQIIDDIHDIGGDVTMGRPNRLHECTLSRLSTLHHGLAKKAEPLALAVLVGALEETLRGLTRRLERAHVYAARHGTTDLSDFVIAVAEDVEDFARVARPLAIVDYRSVHQPMTVDHVNELATSSEFARLRDRLRRLIVVG